MIRPIFYLQNGVLLCVLDNYAYILDVFVMCVCVCLFEYIYIYIFKHTCIYTHRQMPKKHLFLLFNSNDKTPFAILIPKRQTIFFKF